jgi:hypothetical protein
MKGENLFLLAIVVIGGWWLFRDAAKQNAALTPEVAAAREAYLQQQAELQAAQADYTTDYAERLAIQRRMFV